MTRRCVHTPDAPAPVARYSQGCRAGDLVAVAGQVGIDPATGDVADSVGGETDQALANVRAVLRAAGCDLDDVIRMDCYLAGPEHLAAFNAAYARWFPTDPPARTTVFVGLAPGLAVELTALAVAPGR